MVEIAELILDEVVASVQAEGWVFNTEFNYPFQPDTNNNILIPDNVLSFDNNKLSDKNLITRGGKLYDKVAHSFTFETEQCLDVVWLFDFEDLPEAFREYCTIRAANVFAGRAVGSQEAVGFGQKEEVMARANAIEYDTQQGDYNIFENKDGYITYPTYKPSSVTLRYR